MNELIGRLAMTAGVDGVLAEQVVGIMLGFLRGEGPFDKVQLLIDKIRGAEAAIGARAKGAGFTRLMGGGLMAVRRRLIGLGIGIGQIQTIAHELFGFGRQAIGADIMGEFIARTPELRQFA